MTFDRVLKSDTRDGAIEIWLHGQDDHKYQMTLTPDAAMQVVMAVRQAATRLPRNHQGLLEATIYSFAACQPIATEGDSGIVLTTTEGLEIPIRMGRIERAGLRACIDELDAGPTTEGPIH